MRILTTYLLIIGILTLTNIHSATSQNDRQLNAENFTQLQLTYRLNVGSVDNFEISPDGQNLYTYSPASGINVYNLEISETIYHSSNTNRSEIEISGESNLFISAVDNWFKVDEMTSVNYESPPTAILPTDITNMKLLADDSLIVTTSDGMVYIYNGLGEGTANLLYQWKQPTTSIKNLLYVEDAQRVVIIGTDNSMYLFDIEGNSYGQISLPFPNIQSITTDNITTLFIISQSGDLAKYDLVDRKFSTDTANLGKNIQETLYADGKFLLLNTAGSLVVLNSQTREQLISVDLSDISAKYIQVLPNGNILLAGESSIVYLLNNDGLVINTIQPVSTPILRAFDLSPNGLYLGAVDRTSVYYLWDVQTGILLASWSSDKEIVNVTFSTDSKLLLVTDNEGLITQYSLDNLSQETQFVSGLSNISHLDNIPNTDYVLISDASGQNAIIDPITHDIVGSLKHDSNLITTFDTNSELLATGHSNGDIKFWRLSDFSEISGWKIHRESDIRLVAFAYDTNAIFEAHHSSSVSNVYNGFAYWSLHPSPQRAPYETETLGNSHSMRNLHIFENVGLIRDKERGFLTFLIDDKSIFVDAYLYQMPEEPFDLEVSDTGAVIAVSTASELLIWQLPEE